MIKINWLLYKLETGADDLAYLWQRTGLDSQVGCLLITYNILIQYNIAHLWKRLALAVRPIPISPCLVCITQPGTNTLGEPKQWNLNASECRTQRVSFQLAKVVKYSLDWWSGYCVLCFHTFFPYILIICIGTWSCECTRSSCLTTRCSGTTSTLLLRWVATDPYLQQTARGHEGFGLLCPKFYWYNSHLLPTTFFST